MKESEKEMIQISASELVSQEIKRNPYAFYARIREQGALVHVPDFGIGGAWIATNYDDVFAILKDPRFTKDIQKVLPSQYDQAATVESTSINSFLAWRRDLLTIDPPDHTRLRGLVSKAFTPRMIEQLRPRIQQITDELLDAVQEYRIMDLIADFAFPLPTTILSEMLGISEESRQQFRIWTQTLGDAVESPEQLAKSIATLEEFLNHIKMLLDEKRTHPRNDLTSSLIQAEENGEMLSENELISMIFLLIIAGHETTVNLIGVGMLALLQHPEQMRLLQRNPELLPSAIEELLRYTTPVSLSSMYWALEDIPIHDQIIHKGELVFVSLIAANTDPQQFHDPTVLDITRKENQHVTFGKGIHYCLGAPLARLQGQIAFGTLLRRLPNLRLARESEQLIWKSNPVLRSLTSLPVMF